MLRFTSTRRIWAKAPRSASQVLNPVITTSIQTTDPLASLLRICGWGLFCTTYAIIINWIYEGYVDLWHGTYGLEDDDD